MTLSTVTHDTFVIARTYDSPVDTSFEPGQIPIARPVGSPAPPKPSGTVLSSFPG